MALYLRAMGGERGDQFWRVTDREAVLLGIEGAHRGAGSHFVADATGDVWDAIKRRTPWFEGDRNPFHPVRLGPRQHHPRIARPISFSRQRYMASPGAAADATAVALGIGQATALTRRLDAICRTVHPVPSTLGAFGHEIRNLLILAATEVEAHWRGVLVANGTGKQVLSTADYVRLAPPMRLGGYAVGLTSFPWLAPAKPFEGWDVARPTASLPWYEAYNAAKHDREGAFHRATLGHAMDAVAACVVMLVAQFSASVGLGGHGDLRTYFRLAEVPSWEPGEVYCDVPVDRHDWVAVPHQDLAIPARRPARRHAGGQHPSR